MCSRAAPSLPASPLRFATRGTADATTRRCRSPTPRVLLPLARVHQRDMPTEENYFFLKLHITKFQEE
jgi:hypothetical protein